MNKFLAVMWVVVAIIWGVMAYGYAHGAEFTRSDIVWDNTMGAMFALLIAVKYVTEDN